MDYVCNCEPGFYAVTAPISAHEFPNRVIPRLFSGIAIALQGIGTNNAAYRRRLRLVGLLRLLFFPCGCFAKSYFAFFRKKHGFF